MIKITKNRRGGFRFTMKNGLYITKKGAFLEVGKNVDNSDIVNWKGYFNSNELTGKQKAQCLKKVIKLLYG